MLPNGGSLRFYFADGRFEASCPNLLHMLGDHKCRLTRTCHGNGDNEEAGRPVGLMIAWLLDAFSDVDGETHRSVWKLLTYNLSDRRAAREIVTGLGGGADLLAKEREPREGEPEEPLHAPMAY